MEKHLEIIFGKNSSKIPGKLFVNEMDFEIPHGEDYKNAIKELEKIQNTLFENKQFLSLFEYNNTSLWWFIYQSLIPKYKQLINFVETFSNLIDIETPKTVKIEDNFEKFDIIKQICEKRNLNFEFSNISAKMKTGKNKLKQIFQKSRYNKITKTKIETRKNLFFKKYEKIPSLQNKTLFVIPSSYRREIFDHKKGTSSRGEHLLQPIFNLFEEDEFVGVDLDYTFKGDFEILSERLDDAHVQWFPIEIILSPENDSQKTFIKKYSKLIQNKKFQDLFNFRGISLWSTLEQFFVSMIYAPYLPFYLKLIDSLESLFQKNPPKAIFLPYETGPIALAIILASKKFGLKTIGIQHGYIYNYNPMYSFTNFWNQKNNLGFLIPDILLLFGDEAKNLLIKNAYPEKNLFVFGNPNFFNIQEIEHIFSKKPLKEKYGIKKEQKVILFTTGKLQPFYSAHGKYDYDVRIWEHLLTNFSNKDDFFIILKPHPQEKNIDIYKKFLDENKSKNFKIIQGNILELIHISSLVVSVFSSTILDSLCFKKPVIRVKFEDVNPIFDSTDAVLKTNLESLPSNILEILENEKAKNNLLKKGKEFVFAHYGIPEENISLKIRKILGIGEKNEKFR